MAISKDDCDSIRIVEGTLGGKTYHICHPKWAGEERAICFRPVKNIPGYEDRSGMFCERAAGHNTDHKGQGACRSHGGMNHAMVPFGVTDGGRSVMTVKHLRAKIDQYVATDRDQLMDLTFELASLRVMFEELIDIFPDPTEREFSLYLDKAADLVNGIGSLVDRISKVESRNTITANQVLYLRATIADLFAKHITDTHTRELALRDLMNRIAGGDNTVVNEMRNGMVYRR